MNTFIFSWSFNIKWFQAHEKRKKNHSHARNLPCTVHIFTWKFSNAQRVVIWNGITSFLYYALLCDPRSSVSIRFRSLIINYLRKYFAIARSRVCLCVRGIVPMHSWPNDREEWACGIGLVLICEEFAFILCINWIRLAINVLPVYVKNSNQMVSKKLKCNNMIWEITRYSPF